MSLSPMWCRWLIGLVSTLRSAGTQARIATVFDNDHLERAADEAQAGLGRSASARAGAEFSELIKQSHHTFGISAAVNTYLDGVCHHSTHAAYNCQHLTTGNRSWARATSRQSCCRLALIAQPSFHPISLGLTVMWMLSTWPVTRRPTLVGLRDRPAVMQY